MKQKLLLGVVALTSITSLSTNAQTTMTESNFPRGGTFSHVQIQDQSGITLPTTGAGQTWDYSGLTEESSSTHAHADASGDPVFTNALNSSNWTYSFQGMIYYANHFEAIDANAWTFEGRRIMGDSYGLQAVTGDPNDTLKFLNYDDVFANPVVQLQFPASYGTSWTVNNLRTTPYELTVNSYGVFNQPGNSYNFKTLEYNVIGEGQLIIPLSTGGAAPARDAIMVQCIQTNIDSIYLNGAPAPPALMTAFGLTQGTTTIDTTYRFYTPDFFTELLTIGTPLGSITTNWARYTGDADNLGLNEGMVQLSGNVYPNPVNGGASISVDLDGVISNAQVSIVSLTGQVVYQEEVVTNGSSLLINIPGSIKSGLYYVEINSADTQIEPQLIRID